MPIAPGNQGDLGNELRRMYDQAEMDILQKMTKRFGYGQIDNIPPEHWQAKKLKEIREHQTEVEVILKRLENESPDKINEAIREAYLRGADSVDKDISALTGSKELSARDDFVSGEFGRINRSRVMALAENSANILKDSHFQILRSSNDAYRKIVNDSLSSVLAGTSTRVQATQRALNNFADNGITGFVDKAGRNWQMSSYAEMSIRTGVIQSSAQGVADRATYRGHNLVIVSDHSDECGLCRPWEGKVLKLNDKHEDTLDKALAKEEEPLYAKGVKESKAVLAQGPVNSYKTAQAAGQPLREGMQAEIKKRTSAIKAQQMSMKAKSESIKQRARAMAQGRERDAMFSQAVNMDGEIRKLGAQLKTIHEEVYKEVVSQFRTLGGVELNYTPSSHSATMKMLDNAKEFYPKDWLEFMGPRQLTTQKNSRGYFQVMGQDKVDIMISGGGKQGTMTAVHELAHFADDVVRNQSSIRVLPHYSSDLHSARTKGENLVRLNEVTNLAYEDHERTRKDKYADPYMGKEYRDGTGEILSMGMEGVIYDKYKMWQKDPGMVDYILGLVIGI